MLNNLGKRRSLLFKTGILVLIIFGLYVFNIGAYDLWSPDEPRYAEVAREMLTKGNWIIPHLNNEIYYQKPPLFYGIMAAFSALVGKMSVVTVRLPGIILATLLIGSMAYYVSKKMGEKVGLLSGIVLATTVEYFWFAMRVNLDIPLIFCTTLATFLLYDSLQQTKNSNWKGYFAFLLMGIASLIKSPVALLPVLVILIYAWWSGQASKLKKIPWLRGIIVYLAVVGIWIGLAVKVAGYEYFKITVLDQIVGYSTGSQGHPRPIYYYLVNFPAQALPWSLFLIPGFYYGWKQRGKLPSLVQFSLVWFLSIFILLSFVGSKRGLYLLQIYPAFAIILGWYFKEHLAAKIKSMTGLAVPTVIVGLFFLLIGVFVKVKGVALVKEDYASLLVKHPEFISMLQTISWFCIISGIVFIGSLLFKNKRAVIQLAVTFSLVLILMLKVIIMPTVNQVKSERYLAEDLEQLHQPGEQVVLWGSRNRDTGFIFYNGIYFDRILKEEKEVKKLLNEKEEVLLVATESEDFYKHFPQKTISDWTIKEYWVGSDKMLLVETDQQK